MLYVVAFYLPRDAATAAGVLLFLRGCTDVWEAQMAPLPWVDTGLAGPPVHADGHTQHIPIIALTAFAIKGDRERLLAEGFDGYIAKPIDIKEVPRMLERYLGGRPAVPLPAPDNLPPASLC